MTTNLPPHLQEKMDEFYTTMDQMLWPQDSPANMRLRERQRVANEMYSLILQELEPVVELVNGGYEQMQYMNPNVKEAAYNKGVLDVCRRISKHLREGILND